MADETSNWFGDFMGLRVDGGGAGVAGCVGRGAQVSPGANAVNPAARGLGVRDVEFGLALFTAASEDTNNLAGKRWVALTGSVVKYAAGPPGTTGVSIGWACALSAMRASSI